MIVKKKHKTKLVVEMTRSNIGDLDKSTMYINLNISQTSPTVCLF